MGPPGKPSLHILELLHLAEHHQPQSLAEIEGENMRRSYKLLIAKSKNALLRNCRFAEDPRLKHIALSIGSCLPATINRSVQQQVYKTLP